jgi:hypothetical protein
MMMNDFHEWLAENKLQEFSMAQNLMNRPTTAGMNRGLNMLGKSTEKMKDTRTGQNRILGGILKQVQSLDEYSQKRLLMMLRNMMKHPIENQATNPQARYGDTR